MVNEPTFMPGNAHGFIYRGPSWINTNWLIGGGLRIHSAEDLRQTLATQACGMIEQSSFCVSTTLPTPATATAPRTVAGAGSSWMPAPVSLV
ncbi:MAG TPA: hypothetical protein VIU62_03430 [Chloroflexota bacterium]|jgi:hypothetical protein